MTTYAYDPVASSIVATWPTGDGATAHRIARVPSGWDARSARQAAGALGAVSALLWLAYSDELVHQVPFDRLTEAVRRPHEALGHLRRVEEDDRLEAAHQLGRVTASAPGRALRDAVVREVAVETAAVRAADRGDLTGRAQQAVDHPRTTVPDAQLAAAHTLLRGEPFGPVELGTTVEPTAAGVAALRWLRAASTTTAALVGHEPDDVIALAEAMEHEDLRVAGSALRMLLPDGREPDVVTELLHEAVLAGRGHLVVCPDRLEVSEGVDAYGHRVIVTVLDPREPGRSLLVGLVRGIHGCFRVYADEIARREHPGVDPWLTGPVRLAELRERFADDVRQAVRASR